MSTEGFRVTTDSWPISISIPAGKNGYEQRSMSLEEHIKDLPEDVKRYIRGKPEDLQRILSGEVITRSKSNGAGEVKFTVSRKGIDILECYRDG